MLLDALTPEMMSRLKRITCVARTYTSTSLFDAGVEDMKQAGWIPVISSFHTSNNAGAVSYHILFLRE